MEVQTILDMTCPKKRVMQRKSNFWCNQALEESRTKVCEVAKQRTKDSMESLCYKLAINRHQKLIEAPRHKSCKAFCH
jgi:hypothetical protein